MRSPRRLSLKMVFISKTFHNWQLPSYFWQLVALHQSVAIGHFRCDGFASAFTVSVTFSHWLTRVVICCSVYADEGERSLGTQQACGFAENTLKGRLYQPFDLLKASALLRVSMETLFGIKSYPRKPIRLKTQSSTWKSRCLKLQCRASLPPISSNVSIK